MPDDSNAREMEAALHEDDELEVEEDPRTPEEKRIIEEEALAEEEFIADQEDTVNPLIFDDEDIPKEEKPDESKDESLEGAFGSEGLAEEEPVIPISNEEELRKESVNEDELKTAPMSDDFGTDSNPDAVVDEISSLETELGTDGDAAMAAETEAAAQFDNVAEAAPVAETAAPVAEPAPAAPEAAPAPEPAPMATEPAPAPAPEPVAPAAPQPIPAGMPTSSTPAAAPAPAAEQPKKKKTGLIVAILIILVLLVGGAIAGVIWYNQHEAPEKQVSDAIENILDAPVLGTVAKSATIAAGNTPAVAFDYKSEDEPFKGGSLNAEIAFKDSSSVYFKVAGVKTIIDEAKKDALDDDDTDESTSKLMNELYDKISDAIEDKWIVAKIESTEGQYKCLTEVGDKLMGTEFRNKISATYKAHPFVKLKEGATVQTRDGVNYYEVEIDEKISKEFGEELKKTDELKEFTKCVEKITGLGGEVVYDDDETKDEEEWDYEIDEEFDLDIKKEEDTSVEKILLGITPWTHELKAIEVDITDTKNDKKHDVVNISFGTVSDGDLDSATDVKKLVEDITKAVQDATTAYLKEYAKNYCEEYKEYLGNMTVDECVDAMLKEYEKYNTGNNVNILNLMGNLTSTGAVEDYSIVKEL